VEPRPAPFRGPHRVTLQAQAREVRSQRQRWQSGRRRHLLPQELRAEVGVSENSGRCAPRHAQLDDKYTNNNVKYTN